MPNGLSILVWFFILYGKIYKHARDRFKFLTQNYWTFFEQLNTEVEIANSKWLLSGQKTHIDYYSASWHQYFANNFFFTTIFVHFSIHFFFISYSFAHHFKYPIKRNEIWAFHEQNYRYLKLQNRQYIVYKEVSTSTVWKEKIRDIYNELRYLTVNCSLQPGF